MLPPFATRRGNPRGERRVVTAAGVNAPAMAPLSGCRARDYLQRRLSVE